MKNEFRKCKKCNKVKPKTFMTWKDGHYYCFNTCAKEIVDLDQEYINQRDQELSYQREFEDQYYQGANL